MRKIKKSFKLLSFILSAALLSTSLIPSTHALGHNMDISKYVEIPKNYMPLDGVRDLNMVVLPKFIKIPDKYVLCRDSVFPIEKRIIKNEVRDTLERYVQRYECSIERMNFSKDDTICLTSFMNYSAEALNFIIDNHAKMSLEDILKVCEDTIRKKMPAQGSLNAEKINDFLRKHVDLFAYIFAETFLWLDYDTDFNNEILKYFQRVINATCKEHSFELRLIDCLDI